MVRACIMPPGTGSSRLYQMFSCVTLDKVHWFCDGCRQEELPVLLMYVWGARLADVMTFFDHSRAGDSGLHDASGGDYDMESEEANRKGQSAAVAAAEPFEDSATPTVATYDCPVCRKAHVLDLDRLQVPHLNSTLLHVHRPGPSDKAGSLRGLQDSCRVWALLHAGGCLGARHCCGLLSHEGSKRPREALMRVQACRWTRTWTASWWICAGA